MSSSWHYGSREVTFTEMAELGGVAHRGEICWVWFWSHEYEQWWDIQLGTFCTDLAQSSFHPNSHKCSPSTEPVTSTAFLLLDHTESCQLRQLLHLVPYFLSMTPQAFGFPILSFPFKCLWLFGNISPSIFLFSSEFFLLVLPGFSISPNNLRLLGWLSKSCS